MVRFDAGIIAKELGCASLQEHQAEWAGMVRKGKCTMSPSFGKWILTCFGREAKTDRSNNTLRLQDLVGLLVQGHDELKSRRHRAGADAQMHRLLLIEVAKLMAQSPSA